MQMHYNEWRCRDSDGLLLGNNAEVTVLTTDIPIAGANITEQTFGLIAVGDTSCPTIYDVPQSV